MSYTSFRIFSTKPLYQPFIFWHMCNHLTPKYNGVNLIKIKYKKKPPNLPKPRRPSLLASTSSHSANPIQGVLQMDPFDFQSYWLSHFSFLQSVIWLKIKGIHLQNALEFVEWELVQARREGWRVGVLGEIWFFFSL